MADLKYYSSQREDVHGFIPNSPRKILELGCGVGNFSAFLKQRYNAQVVGIELFEEAANLAKNKLDTVYVADIEEFDFSKLPMDFDLIIANDVLEHLRDPWSLLNKLKQNMAPGGYVVASIPNIRHYRIIKDLLFRGNWDYKEAGILDKTHLRFFTRKSILQMFEGAEYKNITVHNLYERIPSPRQLFNYLLHKICPDLIVMEYLVVAKKKN